MSWIRILRYAPGDTAAASAAVSTAFNVGIMLRALTGSITESSAGLAAVPLLGATITLLAVAAISGERWLTRRRSSDADVLSVRAVG